jgi:YD repeat-containing protein
LQRTSWRFDELGALIEVRGAQGHKVQHSRDAQGRVIRTRQADRRQLRIGYNDPQHNAHWGEQVRRQLHNPHFDLLERRPQGAGASGHIECWPDNRIALHAGVRYRFDAHGNRIHAQHPGGAQEHYRYNALHQLVEHTRIESAGQPADGSGLRTTQTTTTHYRHDPFGRRLSKTNQGKASQSHSSQGQATRTTPSTTTYYGWDGDRLVHVEDDHHIRHTVYEAGSFVPML